MTKITIDRVIVEQALEALEQCGLDDTHRSYEFEHAARAALRAALAKPEQDWDEIEALRESLREHMAEIHRLRAALVDHSGDATEMVTTEPDNLLRKGLAQALRGIANGFDKRRPWWRPWSRPDPLIMRTLRRAADELDKEQA